MIGLAYEVTPEGATFAPGITLTLLYDAAKLPANTDPDSLAIIVYNTASSNWDPLKSVVNKADVSVSTDIQHFSVYALTGKIAVPPAAAPAYIPTTTPVSPTTQAAPAPTTVPTPTPMSAQTPSPTPASPTAQAAQKPTSATSWTLIIAIAAAVVAIGLIAFFLVQVRRRRAKGLS